ncbi:short neuropeptide F receptor [Carabus blaptoides fortunei]
MAVPFTPLYSFIGKWIFGKEICHLVPYVQASSVYVSTLTLTGIAIDRYFVIIHPFRQRMKLSTCTAIICSIWLFSMVITLPYGIYMNVVEDGKYCEENWPLEKFEQYFGCFTIIMQCVLPFCIIAFCYICISVRLNRRAKSKPGTKSARKEELDRERKRRTNRMLISMVTIFGICWLPWNIINVIHDFIQSRESWQYFHLYFFLAHLMAMSSTCYNPFLYAWLNENFRKEFKQILPCISKRVSRRFCNGNDHTQDTLLQSTVSNSARCLEPREPTAERIAWSTPNYDRSNVRLDVIKEDTVGTSLTREHAL